MSDSGAASSTLLKADIKISNKHLSTFSHQTICDFNRDIFEITYDDVYEIPEVSTGQAEQNWKIQVGSSREGIAEFTLIALPQSNGGTYARNASVWMCVSRLDGEDGEEEPSMIEDALWKHRVLPDDSHYCLSVTANSVRSKRNLSSNDPELPARYRVVIEYRGEISAEVSTAGIEARLASSNPAMFLEPPTGLVCLKFSGGRKLWIDSDVLCSLSDYFETCLSSDFSEGIVRAPDTISHDSEDTEPVRKKQKTAEDFEDSDEESDEPLPDQPPVSPSNGTSLPFQEIAVSQTSFVTYRALLVWHQTGFIRFAPLTSSFLERHSWKLVFANDSGKNLETAIKTRNKVIDNLVKEDPSLPSPVSPKSIYRLADFLSIPRLKELALRAYSSRLTPQGAVHELLSKDSAFYPEVRKTILDYIARNSQVVINSYGYQVWVQQDPGGGGGGTEDTALVRQLFEALSQSGSRLRKFYGPEEDHNKKTFAGFLFP
ncbi:hypothetical protein JCM5350_005265 [Sporobolomyces pararoseus]